MTDIHADAPAEDVTCPADRDDIARLDGRIDRSEDRFLRTVSEIRADIGRVQASVDEVRKNVQADIGRVQASVDEVRKNVQADIGRVQASVDALNKWKWAAAGVAGLAVVSAPVIAALILRLWPGG